MHGPMKHTWLKLLTSILWSRKFRALPDNDHRMCYIGHLILQKIGLENETFGFISSTLFLSLRKYKKVRTELIRVGLFDQAGMVIGFDDSQLTPEAIRKRRQRDRDKSRDMSHTKSRSCHRDSRKQRAERREEEEGERVREAVDNFDETVKPSPERQSESPPSFAQERMLQEMAEEKGTTIEKVCESLGVPALTRSSVSKLKDHLKDLDPVDPDEIARAARRETFILLRAELAEIYERDGPDQAREFIREHDEKLQTPLWIRFGELELEPTEREATA